MAMSIKFRRGTAATWTSTNPVLAQGEPGVETDTSKFKIGDGSTTWTSLAYAGNTGATQTLPYRSFGDGSDGNVTISSGTTTLTRDMYYNNLTMSGTGKLVTAGWRVFIKGILDVTAAGAGAIQWNGSNGGNASAATGGAGGTTELGGTLGDISEGGSGTTATTGNGTAGGGGTIGLGNGGISGGGGGGGTGTSGGGGGGGAARVPGYDTPMNRFETNFLFGVSLITGGPGGSGGGAGAGDGTNVGGGGGAGGNGGGILAVYANTIVKSAATPASVFQANGGNGGNGGNTSAGVTGGGGGGGGGAGGWIYLCYNNLYGPLIYKMFEASGGQGGRGGSGTGAGATGGAGGNSGTGGRITLYNVPTNTTSTMLGDSSLVQLPELVGWVPAVAITANVLVGGNGGFGGTAFLEF